MATRIPHKDLEGSKQRVKQARRGTTARPQLTVHDWVEIYYALDYKLTSPAVGGDAEGRRWRAHLKQIMKTIGPDGKNMTEPEIVIVMDGGIVQEVLSSEETTVGVVDYDVEDLDRNDLTDIPQGKGMTEAAYVSLNYPTVMPDRTAELLKVIRENVT